MANYADRHARFTLAGEIPKCSAVSLMLAEFSLRQMTTAASLIVFSRPSALPSAFALAIPAICRSLMFERSNSATAGNMVSMALPMRVERSSPDQLCLVDSHWSISLTFISRARRRPAGSSAPPTPKASSPRFENQNDKLSTH